MPHNMIAVVVSLQDYDGPQSSKLESEIEFGDRSRDPARIRTPVLATTSPNSAKDLPQVVARTGSKSLAELHQVLGGLCRPHGKRGAAVPVDRPPRLSCPS